MENPVLLRIAATNQPHLRLRDYPNTVVERNNSKMLRIPIAYQGVFKHPKGKIVLDEETMNSIIKNHNDSVADVEPYFRIRHESRDALGWLEKGNLVLENKVLVAYITPTDEDAVNLIQNKKYKYASMDLHPAYKSNLDYTLEGNDLQEYLEEEETMAVENQETTEEVLDNVETTTDSNNDLQSKFDALSQKFDALTELLTKNEEDEDSKEDKEDEEGNSENAELEAAKQRILELESKVKIKNKNLIVEKLSGHVTSEGKGYDAALLNYVTNLIDNKQLNDDLLALEESSTLEDVHNYYQAAIVTLVLEHVPASLNIIDKDNTEEEKENINLENTENTENDVDDIVDLIFGKQEVTM